MASIQSILIACAVALVLFVNGGENRLVEGVNLPNIYDGGYGRQVFLWCNNFNLYTKE